jgi:hypothetical protein
VSTLLIGIILGIVISPLGFALGRTAFTRFTWWRPVQRRDEDTAPPPAQDGVIEEAVYRDLYRADSGLVERVPR